MNKNTKTPCFEELALKYKTISKKQLDYARTVLNERKKKLPNITIEEILLEEGFADMEQVNLLKFILEFLKLKEKSEKFGALAVKMGYTTQEKVNDALKKQHLEFRQSKIKKIIGDILVESQAITPGQRDAIAEEQQRLSRRNRQKTNGIHTPVKNVHSNGNGQSKKIQESIDNKKTRDHSIEVIIPENCMEAWVKLSDITPGKVSLDEIKTILHEKNVKFGIYNDALLQSFIESKKNLFIAAEGHPPPVNKNMGVKYLFNTPEGQIPSNGKDTDIKIKKGKTIAVLSPENMDVSGRDIFGRQINRYGNDTHKPPVFRCGKGTRISKDHTKAFAGQNGFPFLSIEKKLYILPVTNVLEDADLKFGPIEEFSNINVSGILTGAFPVKAGKITAREIRGTRIKALKDIVVKVGITNARIRTQGNVYAKYIHNSTIEAFGDVMVAHEIIDSTITISGQCNASKSRIIASTISAKQGIIAAGAGSNVTEACILGAGGEGHIISEINRITHKIELAEKKLTELSKQKKSLTQKEKKILKKMTGLKHFYDRVKKEQADIDGAPKEDFPASDNTTYVKTMKLKDDLDRKIESIIRSLKILNKEKQSTEAQNHAVENKIKQIKPGIIKKVTAYKRDRAAFVQWAERTPGRPEIEIRGRVAQGTVFKGIFTSMTAMQEYKNIKIVEKGKAASEGTRLEIVPV